MARSLTFLFACRTCTDRWKGKKVSPLARNLATCAKRTTGKPSTRSSQSTSSPTSQAHVPRGRLPTDYRGIDELDTRDGEEDSENPSLLRIDNAVLAYPGSPSACSFGPWRLSIAHPSNGGHVLLGRNGSGKSLISSTLVRNGEGGVMLSGTFDTEQPWYSSSSIAHVSFESHEEMLRRGGSVSKAIADGGNLTKAAQFLVVRFGLFPLLHRDVRTLSTGEIRKVLLVRALSNRPRLLILDNAFDGLDVPSREILKDLVSRTIKGFRVDILVQAVSAKAAAHTQILLITHREEEIVREIETFSILTSDGALRTFPRSKLCITDAFLTMGLGDSEAADPTDFFELPTEKEIAELWTKHKSYASVVDHEHLVQASNLYVRRGNATLLHGLNWTIQAGQRWLVAGGNGQGKSTLSRLLANDESGIEDGSLVLALSPDAAQRGTTRRRGVGWVSTELHMATARTSHVAMDLLRSDDSTEDTVAAVASWLNLDLSVLSRPFTELSQGQQKLVLIGAAMAPLPDILVLDEPCQGLDHVNRRLVLELIDRFCKATNICLVYITHHLEERIPSITHVLHLANGSPAYLGRVDGYDPTVIKVEQNPEDNKLIHCQ